MTQQTVQDVEKRFTELRKEFSESQWCDYDILNQKVDELIANDLPLAYRLMQRVKNLNPNAESRRQLNYLITIMRSEHPELMEQSSKGQERVNKVKAGAYLALDKLTQSVQEKRWKRALKPFTLIVLIPFLVFSFYQIIWASDRYESRTQLIIKQPDGMDTLDPAMAVLSGFGTTPANNDNELVQAFILSNDMIKFLQDKLNLTEHFSQSSWDFFSRLSSSATQEDLHEYFGGMIRIEIDDASGLITIASQAFTPEFAEQLSITIVERAEWYINEIGHALAKEQLAFVMNEHKFVEERLQKTKSELLQFQRKHDLLDPEAEGMAFQQITYQLEGEIASTQARLAALLSAMSEEAPQVMRLRAELRSLEGELIAQRSRLSNKRSGGANNGSSVGEVLAKFSDLKIDMELALQAYTSSQISLEKSRIEAYRQLKYLVTVESSTLPEDAKYPQVIYNLSLFLMIVLMIFVIGRIISATVNELR